MDGGLTVDGMSDHENESTSRELPDAEDQDDFDDDGLDGLIWTGQQKKSPWHFHYIKGGPKDGKLGMVMPKTKHFTGNSPEVRAKRQAAEDSWEKSALLMHDAQQPLPPPADKPTEVTHRYHPELKRGD